MEIVDYAMPTMKAERALKDMHNAMLERNYDEALKQATFAIVEARLARTAILHEKERYEQR